MPSTITESEVEQLALDILSELGYQTIYAPDISPDGENSERQSYSDVILLDRLRAAIDNLNPHIPREAKEEAVKKILRNESPNYVVNNQHFHKMVVDGVDVEYRLPADTSAQVKDLSAHAMESRMQADKVWPSSCEKFFMI